ncbi:acetate/propionate family kinase [Fibrella aquatilis]|uniref:Acetate kinase n=1 Tax=Fibrella aquatilis TaxID=2817059 RepID=A0A939G1J2_9BACT|nr:acetate/propionate family kinase [Fibrella aquatilis]MBO0930304.1 acetate/propionate family kinase [Fibrella aquatilis]
MPPKEPHILSLNGGSSSIKFAIFRVADTLVRELHGQIDRIGMPGSSMTVTNAATRQSSQLDVAAPDQAAAVTYLLNWLEQQPIFEFVAAVGHRVVHGMHHVDPELITPELLIDLRRVTSLDPDHLPAEIALIDAMQQRHPTLPQVACFDTAFHQNMPHVAQLLAIPRRFEAQGIRRYGFHGLSYAYLLGELTHLAGTAAAEGRVIVAHLGSGASLAAVHGGKGIDTTMGFTPTGGLPMGTRPGDLDPGVMAFLMQSEQMTPGQFNQFINHDCGLLGLSETSADMRDLLANQANDSRAAAAVSLFCYQTKKAIGAFAAVLNGLDTLVFSGGIGEQSPEIRHRICHGMAYLGIKLNIQRNEENASIVSTDDSRVTVWVIPTDEELMMARLVRTKIL